MNLEEARKILEEQRSMDPHIAGNPGTLYYREGWEAIGFIEGYSQGKKDEREKAEKLVDAINKYRVECENVVQDVNFKIHLRKRLFEALSEYSQTPDIIEMRCAPELDTHINGQSCGASHKAKRPSPNTLHKKKGA